MISYDWKHEVWYITWDRSGGLANEHSRDGKWLQDEGASKLSLNSAGTVIYHEQKTASNLGAELLIHTEASIMTPNGIRLVLFLWWRHNVADHETPVQALPSTFTFSVVCKSNLNCNNGVHSMKAQCGIPWNTSWGLADEHPQGGKHGPSAVNQLSLTEPFQPKDIIIGGQWVIAWLDTWGEFAHKLPCLVHCLVLVQLVNAKLGILLGLG